MDNVNEKKAILKSGIVDAARSFVQEAFDANRVECLILYGSSLAKDALLPRDYDMVLLLDTCEAGDIDALRGLRKIVPVEIFIDYKDHILRKGLSNYQRGRHGTYFLACLAYGECLLGDNFYERILGQVEPVWIKRDLLFRIEEYFYRIQKQHLNTDLDNEHFQIKKYLSRILFDILLFNEAIPIEKFHDVHYANIYDAYGGKTSLLDDSLKDLLERYFKKGESAILSDVVVELYELYLSCFEAYTKKHDFREK